MTDDPKPEEPATQSHEDRQHALDRKRYTVERWTLFFLFVYVSVAGYQGCEMKQSVDIAHETFVAANKPSVGVNAINLSYLGKDAKGQPTNTARPNEGSNDFSFSVEVKNFGQVEADNFVLDCRIFVGGMEAPRQAWPHNPSIMFPGKSTWAFGEVGWRHYAEVMNGQKTLDLEITVSYEGPKQKYKYCEIDRFSPRVNAFSNVGACPVTEP